MSTRERLEEMLARGESLANFGFEFRRTYGRLMPAGCCRFDDLLQVSGMGTVRQTMFASMMNPRAETGVWQTNLGEGDPIIRNLAQKLVEARLDEAPPAHVEPGDVMLWLRIVAGTELETFLLSGDKAAHQVLLRPIRTAYAPLVEAAWQHPLRTLGMELKMPLRLPRGKVRAPVELTFHNSGSRPHWVRNPYSPFRPGVDAEDLRRVVYRVVPPSTPDGPTPMPPEKLIAALEVDPANRAAPGEDEYILVEAESTETFAFTVALDLSKPGKYRFDAEYGAFASSEPIDGVHRWAGCMGSNSVEMQIG